MVSGFVTADFDLRTSPPQAPFPLARGRLEAGGEDSDVREIDHAIAVEVDPCLVATREEELREYADIGQIDHAISIDVR